MQSYFNSLPLEKRKLLVHSLTDEEYSDELYYLCYSTLIGRCVDHFSKSDYIISFSWMSNYREYQDFIIEFVNYIKNEHLTSNALDSLKHFRGYDVFADEYIK